MERAVTVSPAAYAQIEAIRDQWLAPLVAQITEQAETIGQLRAERDVAEQLAADATRRAEAAEHEQEELRRLAEDLQARHDALRSSAVYTDPPVAPARTGGADNAGDVWEDPQPLWRRVWRAIRGKG